MERKQRVVARLIRDAISDVIAREVRDPRVGIVSVSSVDLSDPLRQDPPSDRFDGERGKLRALTALGPSSAACSAASPTSPCAEIVFERDRGAEHAEHIARILAEIESDRAQEGEHESS